MKRLNGVQPGVQGLRSKLTGLWHFFSAQYSFSTYVFAITGATVFGTARRSTQKINSQSSKDQQDFKRFHIPGFHRINALKFRNIMPFMQ
jgi:hypothetical protein